VWLPLPALHHVLLLKLGSYDSIRLMIGIIETYRSVMDRWAFLLAATVSFVLATMAGIAGGLAETYIYDRGNSKGDDIAIFASGLLALGTFTFVILFTWLRALHHKISSRTPWFALLFCLAGDLAITVWLWPGGYPGELAHYGGFILVGWCAILFLGLTALLISLRLFIHAPDRAARSV
jgi:hypothetical protein